MDYNLQHYRATALPGEIDAARFALSDPRRTDLAPVVGPLADSDAGIGMVMLPLPDPWTRRGTRGQSYSPRSNFVAFSIHPVGFPGAPC
jgi:hypothetical protein